MFEIWTTPQAWISFLTLAALEIVLGIDNIVFISILAAKLPEAQRGRARKMGLAFALLTRLALLFTISWIMGLKTVLTTVMGVEVTGKSLILMGGGLFLLAKATVEIYENLEVSHDSAKETKGAKTFAILIVQIMLLDVVFSLDSVITAVGMVDHISIMAVAMVVAVIIMLIFANPIGDFISSHPSMKILALAFLVLVGVMLVVEAMGEHIPKGYIYFAMAFSLSVELVNMRVRKARHKPIELRRSQKPSVGTAAVGISSEVRGK